MNLLEACRKGKLEVVEYLVNKHKHTNYNTAIQKAAEFGHFNIVKYLIDKGADVHSNINTELSLLEWAGYYHNTEMIDLVLKTNCPYTKDMAIVYAAKHGRLNTVKYLIEKGYVGNLDLALKEAAKCNRTEVAKFLIEQGADIHTECNAPLKTASSNGCLELVKLLVEKGANDENLLTSTLYHAITNGHLEVVKYLVQRGADIHANRETSLKIAAEHGYLEILKYLIEKGADASKLKEETIRHILRHPKYKDILEILWSRTPKENLLKYLLSDIPKLRDAVKYALENNLYI